MKSTQSCIKWLASLPLQSALNACGKVEETRDTKVHLLLNKLNTAAKDAAVTKKTAASVSRLSWEPSLGNLTWGTMSGTLPGNVV